MRSVTFESATPFDPTFDPQVMAPTSTKVLWEGASVDLANLSTGGRVQRASYNVTEDGIYFASGVVSNREEVIPVWTVLDVDLSQGITQKVRKVGDLTLRLDPKAPGTQGRPPLVLRSISEPQEVRGMIMRQANEMRTYWNKWQQQRTVEQRRAGAVQIGNAGTGTQPPAFDRFGQRGRLYEPLNQTWRDEGRRTAFRGRIHSSKSQASWAVTPLRRGALT